MTLSGDPRWAWRLRVVGVLTISMCLPIGAWAWVGSMPAPPQPMQAETNGAAGPGPAAAPTAAMLAAISWDRKPVEAPQRPSTATAREVRLMAMLNRQGRTVLGLEPAGGRLVFLGIGDEAQGIKVLSIEGRRAEIEVDGERRTVGGGR